MPAEKFCELCACDGPGPEELDNKSWPCPLLGRNICSTCCQHEIEGGMGAEDTLREMCKKSERTPQEVHAACVACPHGGPGLDTQPEVLYVKPGKEQEHKGFMEGWKSRLEWLNGNRKGKRTDDLSGTDDSR